MPYGTILRHYDYPLSLVAEKYGYENIFDLVNDIGRFKSGIQEYRSTAGEVEARNVESRLDFTSAQRRNTLAVSTEDIARDGRYSFQGTSGWTSSHVMCLFWPGNCIFRWK